MLRFLLTRSMRALLTMIFVVTFAFVILRLSGDPALLILSPEAPPEAIEAFRQSWGLDRPLWEQYLRYFRAIAEGNLGRSMRDGRPALDLVLERVPATLAITVPALSGTDYERIESLAALSALDLPLSRAFGALPADQRQAIELRVLEDLSYPEVADALGVPEPTARARVSRGLRALARAVGESAPMRDAA